MAQRTEGGEHDGRQSYSVLAVDVMHGAIASQFTTIPAGEDLRERFPLELPLERSPACSLGKLASAKPEAGLRMLEAELMNLSQRGILRRTIVLLGANRDPLHPFEGRFDGSLAFLSLFERYRPGLLMVQTRSPLIVLALPVLKRLGKHAAVSIGIETGSEQFNQRYAPQLPRVSERIKTVRALRRFGIETSIHVHPLLPYGEWRADAESFATLLHENADLIHVLPLLDGSRHAESRIRKSPLGTRLANERKFHWLRPDAATPLLSHLERICPQKLLSPDRRNLLCHQLKLFAA